MPLRPVVARGRSCNGLVLALGFALFLIGVSGTRLAQGADMDAGYASEMVRREMVQRYGDAAYRVGLRVTTTIDGRLQRLAEAAVREAILAYDRRHGDRGPKARRRGVSAALLAIAPRDGAIRALVGGNGFGADQFNRAVDARRQPGSAFKPFVYAAALADGWTPASLVQDVPVALPMGGGEVWTPANFDHRALGPIRLRRALAQSRNLAAIDLLDRIGIDYARTFAARFGFDPLRLPRNLTLALGTGEVSLAEMAAAYAVFANGGFAIEPYLIARIVDRNGQVLFRATPPRACETCWFQDPGTPAGAPAAPGGALQARRVLEPWLAYQMHSMLQDVVRVGTGRRALALRRADLAGKTGTTNDVRDAWFCGYQSDLVAVAWMGFDDSSPLGRGETGGELALRLWMAFMGKALAGRPEAVLPVPAGLVRVRFSSTGLTVAGPGEADAVTDWVREQDLADLLEPDPVSIIEEPIATDPAAPSIIEGVY